MAGQRGMGEYQLATNLPWNLCLKAKAVEGYRWRQHIQRSRPREEIRRGFMSQSGNGGSIKCGKSGKLMMVTGKTLRGIDASTGP